MITSIKQAHTEFFRIFHEIRIPIKGVLTKIPCRYARKSSFDYAEEQDNQSYPCIAIQDYTPELKEEWYIDMKPYFGGVSADGLKGFIYRRPVWMSFKYDVSIVSKSYTEFLSMQDYFLEKFVSNVRFLYNQKLSGEEAVGDIVPYTIRETDVPRTDGVFEKNYEFNLSVWVYPQEPQEVSDLVEKISLELSNFGV